MAVGSVDNNRNYIPSSSTEETSQSTESSQAETSTTTQGTTAKRPTVEFGRSVFRAYQKPPVNLGGGSDGSAHYTRAIGRTPEANGDLKVPSDPNTEEPKEAPAPSDNPADPPFSVVSNPPLDPQKPTAVFVDDFRDAISLDRGDPSAWTTHGEVSRRNAEQAGYNTIGLQQNINRHSKDGGLDYGDSFREINRRIDSGEMKLGKGDVVNVSMGQWKDPTYDEASKFLGFEVTPQNIDPQRIVNRMKEIAADPKRSDEEKGAATRVAGTNDAISALQARGISVVHAAGNREISGTEPQRFSWDFLTAKYQLSSQGPGGVDSFSAANNLTTPSDGVLPVKYDPSPSLYDSTPLAYQRGSYQVGTGGPVFPAPHRPPGSGDGRFPANDMVFDRSAPLDQHRPLVRPKEVDVGPFVGEPTTRPPEVQPGRVSDSRLVDVGESPNMSELKPGEQAAAGTIQGTSFANLQFLRDHKGLFDTEKGLAATGD